MRTSGLPAARARLRTADMHFPRWQHAVDLGSNAVNAGVEHDLIMRGQVEAPATGAGAFAGSFET